VTRPTNSYQLANAARLTALTLCHTKNASHIGGAYSVVDILAVLYMHILNINPRKPDDSRRDRLFYSKGHASAILYAVLDEMGFLEGYDLKSDFTKDGSFFTSHVNHKVPGVEFSTGSLGHALGVACGSALGGARFNLERSTYAILSDGELNEGSNWEAIMFAAHHNLHRLTLIIDYNKIQSFGRVEEVMQLEPLAEKFTVFGWHALEVDGHDHEALHQALLLKNRDQQRPTVIVAHTIKGKGVSFMEDSLAWHYKSPNLEQFEQAQRELQGVKTL